MENHLRERVKVLKLASPAAIKAMMQKYGFKFSKKLGQNFLKEQNIVDKIVAGAALSKKDLVIEVGPGMGTMTAALAEKAGFVIGIELDRQLLPVLAEHLGEQSNIRIIHGDILKLDLNQVLAEEGLEEFNNQFKVVANLPYYITTPVIMHFLEHQFRMDSMVIMVQKEVAMRIIASPGSKEFGALSVAVQYYGIPELLFTVPKSAFIPQPEVESAVLRITVRKNPAVNVKDERLFFQVVKGAFGQRRKTLLNALTNAALGLTKQDLEAILEEVRISPTRRGETLSLEEFADITNLIIQKRKQG